MKGSVVLFDLDGTLIDTAPDMVGALNQLLIDHQKKPRPFLECRPFVSMGSYALIKQGFGLDHDDPFVPELRERFLMLYAQRLSMRSCYFKGVPELLCSLHDHNIRWGIVTNKPAFLAKKLLVDLPPISQYCCLVCPEDAGKAKPHPEPILHAIKTCAIEPEQCIYVGDDKRDMQASVSAGVEGHVAMWGYLGNDSHPDTWNGHSLLQEPAEVLTRIKAKTQPT